MEGVILCVKCVMWMLMLWQTGASEEGVTR
jgi:hypothetical protein